MFSQISRKQLASEFLGTYLLVLIGPGSVVAISGLGLSPLESLVSVALVFGSVVAGVILLLGRVSGAHINPAITLASVTSGSLRRGLLLPYVGIQLVAAIVAGLSLELAFRGFNRLSSLGSTKLATGISPLEGTIIEVAGTFVLAVSALSAGTFLPGRTFAQAALVGSTLFLLIIFIGPLTGASFNPARSLGPSLVSGYFSNQVVYYVGPLMGGLLAGLAFTGVRSLAR